MDSGEILDDKDNGPEVQINVPSSVMSRIEELMGGTEQFDSADFDAVAYINKMFPTEQSLSGIEAATAKCQFRLAAVHEDIRKRVRMQPEQRCDGQKALLDAQDTIRELAVQVTEINKKAERSASMVREITAEIKQLDCAKTNLTAAITTLNHVHLLAGGTTTLRELAAKRLYNEIALPHQAIMEVLQQLESYRQLPELGALREQIMDIRRQLADQIMADFKDAFTGGSKSVVSHKCLREACSVVDVLEPRVKHDLLTWLIDLQLQEYVHLFSPEQEQAWVSHVERRYAWLKKHLLAFEDGAAQLFPRSWAVSELIARKFCEITRSELGSLLASRRAELDVKLLLYAIQKTHHFELLLHKRFVGTDLGIESVELPAVDKTEDADVKQLEWESSQSTSPSPAAGSSGGWVGLIGACFEPHLSLYITSLDANLKSLLHTFVQDTKSLDPSELTSGGGAVLSSCAELFLFYKKCLVQCSRLTTGEPVLELCAVFGKYLREYAGGVLAAWLPRGAALSPAAYIVTILRDDSHHARYTKQEISKICSVITTSEYCLETTIHLEQKLKEKVAQNLADKIDLLQEQEIFQKLISDCIQLLVQDLETACEPALQSMTKYSWSNIDSVGDQSSYITQIIMHLKKTIPNLRDNLASSRKYFTQFCIRFANSFIPKFMQNINKCKPISTIGAEQLLLDTHMLKTALLELPSLGSEVKRPAPATYTKVVVRLMARCEGVLKLVLAPDCARGDLSQLVPPLQLN